MSSPVLLSAAELPEPDGAQQLLRRLDLPGLRTAADLARARREGGAAELFPSGLPALDRLLGGGLARGELAELVGERSGGRLTLLLTLLAATTGRGEGAAFVDLGDAFDPQLAVLVGVELPRLLWLRPRTLREAVAATEIAVSGGLPLVALDLGERPLPGGRGSTILWQRLAHSSREHRAALLVASPCRVSGPAAALVVATARGRRQWAGRSPTGRPLFTGGEIALLLEKGRGGQRGERAALWLAPTATLAIARPRAAVAEVPAPLATPAVRRAVCA